MSGANSAVVGEGAVRGPFAFLSGQAIAHRRRHVPDQVEIQIGTIRQTGTQGVDCAGLGVAAFQNDRDQARFELGFREDTGCAEMFHAVADFVNAFRARCDFRADCDRPCGMQPESLFEIPIGVMKNDVLCVVQRRKFGGDFID